MASIRARADNNRLFFDFVVSDVRCREQTALVDSPSNRKRLEKMLQKIEAEITLGTFEYGKYFPNSPRAEALSTKAIKNKAEYRESPLFSDFTETWFSEMRIQWRSSHAKTIRGTLDNYLLPTFNGKEVARITRADILEFRSTLAKVRNRDGKGLSASRINKIMAPLRMIL